MTRQRHVEPSRTFRTLLRGAKIRRLGRSHRDSPPLKRNTGSRIPSLSTTLLLGAREAGVLAGAIVTVARDECQRSRRVGVCSARLLLSVAYR
jgi:hypothetical protein